MQHETAFATVSDKAARLNDQTKGFTPLQVLEFAFQQAVTGRIGLVSSFGAESVVLLHMVALIDKNLPVLFLDTEMLFDETLVYQTDVARQLGLTNVRRIRPDLAEVSEIDPDQTLNKHDKGACCDLRKTRPLERALHEFDTWITGRKRFQSGTRAALENFEADGDQRIKVNPLAHWQPKDLGDYITAHDLPRHPMIARGFPSIGCAPCTSAVKEGESSRAGRWRDSDKTECGIHFSNGRMVRGPVTKGLSE